MEKAGENSGSSSNVELNLGLSLNGGSQRSVASNATEVETQQPRVPEIYPKGMMMRSVLMSTPRVFTRGEGPNGKKTDGFLYSYKKKEDIKIVCVCHGYILTPAEFVKHAGGGDVENPLRQIIINPMPK